MCEELIHDKGTRAPRLRIWWAKALKLNSRRRQLAVIGCKKVVPPPESGVPRRVERGAGVPGSLWRGGGVGVSVHGGRILEEGTFAARAIDQKLVKGLQTPITAAPHLHTLGFSSPAAGTGGASSGAGLSATGCVGLAP